MNKSVRDIFIGLVCLAVLFGMHKLFVHILGIPDTPQDFYNFVTMVTFFRVISLTVESSK